MTIRSWEQQQDDIRQSATCEAAYLLWFFENHKGPSHAFDIDEVICSVRGEPAALLEHTFFWRVPRDGRYPGETLAISKTALPQLAKVWSRMTGSHGPRYQHFADALKIPVYAVAMTRPIRHFWVRQIYPDPWVFWNQLSATEYLRWWEARR